MGPLDGITVIEIASLAPGQFCGMMLADLGADVIRVDRIAGGNWGLSDVVASGPLLRGRRSIAVDLKNPEGAEVVLRLVDSADALVEGFRPGVAERLGIGPEVCCERNPALVYGRLTGWGREGPLASMAGHDLNYLAGSGVLHPIGRVGEAPVPPLNMVADFGGGGLLAAFGIVIALLERARSGLGQVVDAAMIDGAALQTTLLHGLLAHGLWTDERGVNLLDGGAPFYDSYRTADGGYLAVAALEPQFFAELIEGLGLDAADLPPQYERARWPELRERLAAAIRTRTRSEWEETFAGTDACASPVLSLREAPEHPHHRERRSFIDAFGVVQPAPAPRFERTPAPDPGPVPSVGEHTEEVLAGAGFGSAEIAALRTAGAIA